MAGDVPTGHKARPGSARLCGARRKGNGDPVSTFFSPHHEDFLVRSVRFAGARVCARYLAGDARFRTFHRRAGRGVRFRRRGRGRLLEEDLPAGTVRTSGARVRTRFTGVVTRPGIGLFCFLSKILEEKKKKKTGKHTTRP